ncbi:MAG: hypothetical protein BAJATHORv1_20057 [Candidatus Thorarchaeota archaeon]|nr:MAG: hypothetical protein BAJATHORv1_20057 [Candidatus Thorarchaeota archaeon]
MVSTRVKFIAITIDELVLIPIAIAIVYFFVPELLLPISVLLIVGAVLFVAVKYYLVYPSLQESNYYLYSLDGAIGKVTQTVTPQSGKIKVGQEIWDARCDEGQIPTGAEVQIVARDSMRVKVVPRETTL